MKTEFSISELRKLVDGQNFSWNWTASQGNSGGTLIRVKQGDLDAEEMCRGNIPRVPQTIGYGLKLWI
jgi:hypothetical protein